MHFGISIDGPHDQGLGVEAGWRGSENNRAGSKRTENAEKETGQKGILCLFGEEHERKRERKEFERIESGAENG